MQTAYLLKEIKSHGKEKTIYGKKGEKVQVLRLEKSIAIVGRPGYGFAVKLEEIQLQ